MMHFQTNDELAIFFDQCAKDGLMLTFDPEEQSKLDCLLSEWDIREGHRIFEAGCGAGRLTEQLASKIGGSGEIFACDLSAEMLAFAKQRKLPEHVSFVCASALDSSCPANWFNRILCLNVFPHFLDKPKILREFRRIIAQDGTMWINHLCSRKSINHFHSNASDEVANHILPDEEEMGMLLKEAGFVIISLKDSDAGYSLKAIPV